MPARSPLPDVAIPHQDIWGFLFERKDREFPDDKGEPLALTVYLSQSN